MKNKKGITVTAGLIALAGIGIAGFKYYASKIKRLRREALEEIYGPKGENTDQVVDVKEEKED